MTKKEQEDIEDRKFAGKIREFLKDNGVTAEFHNETGGCLVIDGENKEKALKLLKEIKNGNADN